MNDIFELVVIVAGAVMSSTAIYHVAPFRKWVNKKPCFTVFPKYVAHTDKSLSEIHSTLELIDFKENKSGKYTRGKVYGDFSANAVKLTVEFDEPKNQVKIYASFFGVFFDTGDLWQVTSEIVNN